MHWMADLFTWFFVERTDKESGTLRVELWREEVVIGEMALYRQEIAPSLEPGDIIEPWLARGLNVYSWPEKCPEPSETEIIHFLGALERKRTAILNHAVAETEVLEARAGRILHQAILDCFLAGKGEARKLAQEDVQLLQQVRHLWMLAAVTSEGGTKFSLCAHDRYYRDPVKFPPTDLMRTQLMEIADGDDRPRKLAWVFPRDVCDYFSLLGAIAREDPYRFNAVKGLLAHAAHLGWQHNLDSANLPVPSLQED